MQVTITLDTDKETVEDLKRLQQAIDELIGKKLGAVSQHTEPKPEPLQTHNPEPAPTVESAGFPTQPEETKVDASSPHELGQQVAQQSQEIAQQQPAQEQPRGWPTQEQSIPTPPKPEPAKQEGKPKVDDYEDLSGMLSDIFSKTKT